MPPAVSPGRTVFFQVPTAAWLNFALLSPPLPSSAAGAQGQEWSPFACLGIDVQEQLAQEGALRKGGEPDGCSVPGGAAHNTGSLCPEAFLFLNGKLNPTAFTPPCSWLTVVLALKAEDITGRLACSLSQNCA